MLPGDDRGAAACFALNGKCYVGTGIKFSVPVPFHDDFWEFDPASNTWAQKANFPFGRCGAVGFAVLGKGYIACGSNPGGVLQDVWEYDVMLNTWTQKSNLPGPARNYTVAFTIGSYAYIGTGYDANSTSYHDLWRFDPVANLWVQKSGIGTIDRSSCMAFAVGGKGYIGGGYSSAYLNDFWEYNPVADAWTQRASFPNGGRSDGSAFAIGNYGYILTGQLSISTTNDMYMYNPMANTWTQKLSLLGSARSNGVACATAAKGYIGTGYDPGFITLNDWWEYTPDSALAIEEQVNSYNIFSVVQNIISNSIIIFSNHILKEKLKISIYDFAGKTVYKSLYVTSINASQFKKGMYIVELSGANYKEVRKLNLQ